MAIANITKSAIERLIKKISVKVLPQFYIDKPIRVNSIIYEETRVKIQNFLQQIIDDSCTIATFMGKKTVSSSHIYPLLRFIPISYHSLSGRKKCSTDKSEKECLAFPVESMKRLIRELGNGFRFSDNAFLLLQVYVEHYITEMLKLSILMLNHSKRNTLEVRDMHLANRQIMDNYEFVRSNINQEITLENGFGKSIENAVAKLLYQKSISKNCRNQIDQILQLLLQCVCTFSLKLTNSKKIEINEVKTAITLVLKDKSLNLNYCDEKMKKNEISKERLQIVKNLIKNDQFSEKALMYCTLFIDYMIKSILNIVISPKKQTDVTITSKDINTAFLENFQFSNLISSLGLFFDE